MNKHYILLIPKIELGNDCFSQRNNSILLEENNKIFLKVIF